ncbi:hypothetical protein lacNasYZ03_02940 [Lactobacillus nasalidis]|uniref:Uncharacterized protein n=1 Tax=Lactobacillus nasalidis TaxID=2797258 RepID=A0ABQ3W8U5_9LACO|nr:hypothetical protein [Lactobacillus nasalidis]GHV97027.1 hypothetical protein lacNasYZ01_02090 [Lactobacillus nasalidis]GHV99101.1 hypothetical protein lacNasYZ02_05310 [Lactobacillus nasalidis]GHW00607.1 hypothetical protein lacNasYZ03_02940 [Lactobacillus nasalidis]
MGKNQVKFFLNAGKKQEIIRGDAREKSRNLPLLGWKILIKSLLTFVTEIAIFCKSAKER